MSHPAVHPPGADTPLETSLSWDEGSIVAVDQRALPGAYHLLRLDTVDEVIDAIRALAVRGAPALGLAGALGVALSARRHRLPDGAPDDKAVRADAQRLAEARPTAVNLAWGVQRALACLPEGADAVLAEARAMLAEDVETNRAAAHRAADVVTRLVDRRPLRILTHCNTGRLATAAVGTALGAIVELARRGLVDEVLVDETRPLLQGARLTAWELGEAGIPYRICVDSAAAAAMDRGLVDVVLVGADRITAGNDVANKIGTYGLAVAAARHRIPFVVVAPESTWDPELAHGADIVVEERSADEVTAFAGTTTAPPDAAVYNPAFDVTPGELVTALVSEARAVHPQEPPQSPALRFGAEIAAMSKALYGRGWMPGTAGNISLRLPDGDGHALITGSGLSKGELGADDMVLVQAGTGEPVGTGTRRASAETAIHAAVYATTDAGAVIHVHSPYATAVARPAPGEDVGVLPLDGFELLKGLGLADPSRTDLPVFVNWPAVSRIADDVARYLSSTPQAPPALLVADHGITTWGRDLTEARNRLECVESICQLLLLTGHATVRTPQPTER
ncbi:S-methyl-5-thioribose-1-phosphate isomerase [Streptomyces odontomachi]|uniref:S-methyl-5-thioribose-1-phosphate isomerase n=1 Tax=Streptomyces odontomachi TaxID=2944940 RepID=UPI00210BC9EA|nr:S-methyl-5-thioribose-1-phosphate isomerase [Streptomyces sp. ODS25]